MSISRVLVMPVTVAAVLTLAACGDSTDGTATTAAASGSSAEAAPAAPAGPPPATPVEQPPEYLATTAQVTGDTGRVRYDVTVPQVEGGDPEVAAEFNESIRAALQDQIDGSAGERFTLESRPESGVAHIGSRVLSGLLVTSWNADPPGAHPTPVVATVVIDADNAQPITLTTLFPDLQAGLNRLSEESARLLPATAAGADFERSGIEPTRQNFANWLATPAGMEIHFTDYQVGPHAIGLVQVTVPWERLRDVMAPAMVGVVAS
ncbi:RsiV family protein [Rhodococcus sp. NPDC058532]|uniref:RsiV family protein n=1 Tax=Rhodococcus sp. NPDC058532 TaxID=3346540 RepID=UPI0036591109